MTVYLYGDTTERGEAGVGLRNGGAVQSIRRTRCDGGSRFVSAIFSAAYLSSGGGLTRRVETEGDLDDEGRTYISVDFGRRSAALKNRRTVFLFLILNLKIYIYRYLWLRAVFSGELGRLIGDTARHAKRIIGRRMID